jgi:hypothetical protein
MIFGHTPNSFDVFFKVCQQHLDSMYSRLAVLDLLIFYGVFIYHKIQVKIVLV